MAVRQGRGEQRVRGKPVNNRSSVAFIPLTINPPPPFLEQLHHSPKCNVLTHISCRGRMLSHDFLRLPSKRQYPDYYQLIKRPISLDEIKTQLENGLYTTLEDVKQDFETCFKNAKRYNMKDSQIWKDAKQLHVCVLNAEHLFIPLSMSPLLMNSPFL